MSDTYTKTEETARHTPQARQLTIRSTGDHFVIIDGHGCFFAKTYFEPDARRIAAVFDLLDALRTVVATEYDRDEESRNFDEERLQYFASLIAEAEGRAP